MSILQARTRVLQLLETLYCVQATCTTLDKAGALMRHERVLMVCTRPVRQLAHCSCGCCMPRRVAQVPSTSGSEQDKSAEKECVSSAPKGGEPLAMAV